MYGGGKGEAGLVCSHYSLIFVYGHNNYLVNEMYLEKNITLMMPLNVLDFLT